MGATAVSIAILVVASIGALLTAVRWWMDKRDVSVRVGARTGGKLGSSTSGEDPKQETLSLEVVNTGGSKACHLTVVLSFPPGVDVDGSSGWVDATPNATMPTESTAVAHRLGRCVKSNGRYELPSLHVQDNRGPITGTRNVCKLMWEAWWILGPLKRGLGAEYHSLWFGRR